MKEILVKTSLNENCLAGSTVKADDHSANDLIRRGAAVELSSASDKDIADAKKQGQADAKSFKAAKEKELKELKAKAEALEK